MKNFTITRLLSGSRSGSDSGRGTPLWLTSVLLRMTLLLALLIGFVVESYTQQVVTNPTTPWLVPKGVTAIKVEVWGGGGAGGGAQSTGLSWGTGGGGGACSIANWTVAYGESYTIAQGTGGTGVADGKGNDGTPSSVTGTAQTVSGANGLGGGRRAGGTPGAGGIGTYNGGNGGASTGTAFHGAGGGGGAGNGGNGNNGSSDSFGTGGIGSLIGPIAGGNGGAIQTNNGTGNAGNVIGGGGSGGYRTSGGDKAGGTGGDGAVVITFDCPDATIAYDAAEFCTNDGTQTVTVTGSPDGTFSAETGLTIDPATGTITTSTSTAGDYVVHYQIESAGASCTAVDATFDVTIKDVSDAPVVTSPICVGVTSVSGTSESGASVDVYVNGSNTITVTAIGTDWTATVSALAADDVITAYATATGECISAVSNTVTVATTAAPVITSPVCVGTTSVSGTSESGASVDVYVNGTNTVTVTATGTAWTATVTALATGDIVTAKATATDKCESEESTAVTVTDPSITFTATATNASNGTTPGPVNLTFCPGDHFGYSGFSKSDPLVGMLDDLVSSDNVLYNGSAVPDVRPQEDYSPSEMDTYFEGTAYGPYTLASGNTGSITETFTPYYDANENDKYDAGIDCIGAPVVIQYNFYLTVPPVVTSPICVDATEVSGTSSEADGTEIEVFVGATSLGTTTVAAGVWTLSGLAALADGDLITAYATPASGCVSLTSNSVTVATTDKPVVTSPICVGATTITGTCESGAAVDVYVNGTVKITATTSLTAWTATSVVTLSAGDIVTAYATEDKECISEVSDGVVVATTDTPVVTSPICVNATSVSGTSTEPDGTMIQLYVNDAPVGSPVSVTGGAWTISGLSPLADGKVVTAKATETDECESAVSIAVTVATTAVPVISTPICAGTTTISGTSEGSATITVYANDVQIGEDDAVAGVWTVTVSPAFIARNHITVTATSTDKCVSAATSMVHVLPVTARPVITTTLLCAGTTTISGTSGEAFAEITIYAGDTEIGHASANGVNQWTATVTHFHAGDIITAIALTEDYCVSAASDGITVTDYSVAPVITTDPLCAGSTTVSGTTIYPGASVVVYRGAHAPSPVPIGPACTADGSGNWTATVTALVAEDHIYAISTPPGGCPSEPTEPVHVLPLTARPVITDQICGGTTTISGTSEAFATILVYNGLTPVALDAPCVAEGDTHWTATTSAALVPGSVISVTAEIEGKCVSILSAPVTVLPEPKLSFKINDVLMTPAANYPYCYDVPVGITVFENLGGVAPFNVTYTVNGEAPITKTGLNVGDPIVVAAKRPAGVYNLVVTNITDHNECQATAGTLALLTSTVTINAEPMISFGFNSVEAGHNASFTYCYNQTVGVTLHTIYGGTAPFSVTYTLDGGSQVTVGGLAAGGTIADPQLLATGPHDIVVTDIIDANLCHAGAEFLSWCTASITINEEPKIQFAFNGVPAGQKPSFEYCYDEEVGVTLNANLGGTAPFDVTYTVNGTTPVTVYDVAVGGVIMPASTYPHGVYNVVVTDITDAKGCQAGETFLGYCQATITINPSPDISLVVGGAKKICPTYGTNITVALSEDGTMYQLRNDAGDVNIGVPVEGDLGTITLPTGELTATTTFNVYATTKAGCSAELTGLVTIIVEEYPILDLVVGGSGVICTGTSTNITVTGSEVGASYQLRVEGVEVGSEVPGTGGTISLPTGPLTTETTFNVYATLFPCTAHQLEQSAKVTINPSPMISFGFNGVEAGHNASFAYCYDQPVTVSLYQNYVGTAPFSVSYTIDGALVPNTVTGLYVGDNIAGPETLEPGDHTIVVTDVTDANSCHASAEFLSWCIATITIHAEPMISFGFNGVEAGHNANFAYCYNEEVGVKLQNIYGGVAPFSVSYTIDGTPATPVTGLAAGGIIAAPQLYSVGVHEVVVTEITDAKGCQASEEFLAFCKATITINEEPMISFGFNEVEAGHNASFEYCYDQKVGVCLHKVYAGTAPFSVTYTVNGTGSVTVDDLFAEGVIVPSVLYAAGVYNIAVTNITDAKGCQASAEFLAFCTATITIHRSPDITLTVGGTNAICEENTGQDITVELSENGTMYQLRNVAGDVNIGVPVEGDGGTITLPTGPLTATTTFYVYATTEEGCSAELTNKAVVTVRNYPDKTLNVEGGGVICTGTSADITVELSEIGVDYRLRNDADDSFVGSFVAGTGGTIHLPTGPVTTATTFNVWSRMFYCSGKELNELVVVTVGPIPTLTSVTPSLISACEFENVSFTAAGLIPSVSTTFTYTVTPGGSGTETVTTLGDGTYTFAPTNYLPGTYDIVINTVSVGGCTKTFNMATSFTVHFLPEVTDVTLQASVGTVPGVTPWPVDGIFPSFKMCIDRLLAIPSYYFMDINTLASTVPLAPSIMNGFTLDQTSLPPTWISYWSSHGVVPGATGALGIMWKIVNGVAPHFYIKYTGSDYQIIDGLTWQAFGVELPLGLSGQYPEWTYKYTGSVTDVNGCISGAFDINLSINAVPVPTVSGATPVCAGSTGIVYTTEFGKSSYDWDVTGGTITSGGTSVDNTVTVTWLGEPSGTVSVNYTNPESGCTAAAATVKIVTIGCGQPINISTGWNIISSAFIPYLPENQDLLKVFQPMTDEPAKLKKVMDERGLAMSKWPSPIGWRNNIGDILQTEGYLVNSLADYSLTIGGSLITLPLNIPLVTGWNIISYPSLIAQDGQAVVQDLIDDGYLVKVMDEAGHAIEDWGSFWNNGIGDFVTGEGYQVKVNHDCILTIEADPGMKSGRAVTKSIASSHFTPAFSGNGYAHMNINLVELNNSGLMAGDEIGIFDGKICVGAATIGSDQITSGIMSIPVSANDGLSETPNGFTEGNSIALKLFSNGVESRLKTEVLNNGSERFKMGESLFVKVGLVTGYPGLVNTLDVKFYPNPFTYEIFIEINSSGNEAIDLMIYDVLGRKVRSLFKGTVEGTKIIKWDGTNDIGDQLNSGMYYMRSYGSRFNGIVKL